MFFHVLIKHICINIGLFLKDIHGGLGFSAPSEGRANTYNFARLYLWEHETCLHLGCLCLTVVAKSEPIAKIHLYHCQPNPN